MAEGPALVAPRLVRRWHLGRALDGRDSNAGASVIEVLADRVVRAARAWGDPRVVWLDPGGSVEATTGDGVLTAFPVARWQARSDGSDLVEGLDGLTGARTAGSRDDRADGGSDGLRFRGGWLGHLAYEAVEALEPVHLHARREKDMPLASWALHPVWFRVRPMLGVLELWSRLDGDPERGPDGTAIPSLMAWLHWAEEAVRAPLDNTTPMYALPSYLTRGPDAMRSDPKRLLVDADRSFSPEGFRAAVMTVQEAIREGEVFQANLAHRLQVRTQADPFHLHLVLRRMNPSPFAAYVEEPWGALVSNSPERLFRVHEKDGVRFVEARPIAGTCPRTGDQEVDAAAVERLRASAKERAEHTMLVDLLRNDIGRVAVPGSVAVDVFQLVERYSHVHHLVSNVRGVVAPEVSGSALFRALFPGGTITGAPKLRSIEVIDRVEPVARGPYTGGLGYINEDGTLDLNILIRTVVVKGGVASVYAGAGIVADSDPVAEYDETLHKAAAMLAALDHVDAQTQGDGASATAEVSEAAP